MGNTNLPDGMTLRGRVYWADFRAGGRRVRKSLSSNLKTAKQLLIELRARVQRGDYGLLDNDVTIAELRDEYLKHCGQTRKPGTVERYERNLMSILPYMPPKVSQVTVQRVLTYRADRLAVGTSPGTINMDVVVLGAMLNWGVKYQIIGSNPIKGLEPVPHDRPREGRALTDDEVSRLMEHSPQHYADIWYALLVTGMRINELASLRFADIDWASGELIIQRGIAKNHQARRIPIDNGLREILDAKREGRAPEERVFVNLRGRPLQRGPVRRAFVRFCERAGIQTLSVDSEGHEIDHVDVHSLRRTFATNLIVGGTDPKTVQELMGHKTLKMTMKLYAKIHTGTKRQAIGRLSYGRGTEPPEHIVEFRAS
jgi:integrase